MPQNPRLETVQPVLPGAVLIAALAFPVGAVEAPPVECLQNGCTLVPNYMLELNNQAVEKMKKEIIRLRAVTGCA